MISGIVDFLYFIPGICVLAFVAWLIKGEF